MEKENFFQKYRSLIFSICIAITSTATMALSLLALSTFIVQETVTSTVWIMLAVAFASAALRQFCFFFRDNEKLVKAYRIVNAIALISLAVLNGVLPGNYVLLAINGLAYIVTLLIFIGLKLIYNHKLRNVIVALLCAGMCIFLFVTCLTSFLEGDYFSVIIVSTMLLSLLSFLNIIVEAFAKIHFGAIKNVVVKTFAGEILLGLVFLIIAFSFVFMVMEGVSYWDALWYCFAIVTTIGFGDVSMTSPICRVVSVILGIYGIIVVSLITSIIVNVYNETKEPATKQPKNKKK